MSATWKDSGNVLRVAESQRGCHYLRSPVGYLRSSSRVHAPPRFSRPNTHRDSQSSCEDWHKNQDEIRRNRRV